MKDNIVKGEKNIIKLNKNQIRDVCVVHYLIRFASRDGDSDDKVNAERRLQE